MWFSFYFIRISPNGLHQIIFNLLPQPMERLAIWNLFLIGESKLDLV